MKTTGLRGWEVLKLAEKYPELKCCPSGQTRRGFVKFSLWSADDIIDRGTEWDIQLLQLPEQTVTITKAQLETAWNGVTFGAQPSALRSICKALGFTEESGDE